MTDAFMVHVNSKLSKFTLCDVMFYVTHIGLYDFVLALSLLVGMKVIIDFIATL